MLTEISALRICVEGWTQILEKRKRTKLDTVLDGSKYLNDCPLCELASGGGEYPDCHKCPALGFWSGEDRWRRDLDTDDEEPLCVYNEFNTHWIFYADPCPVLAVLKDALEWWLALKEMNEV